LADLDLSLSRVLEELVGDSAYFENYLYDQQFSHRGWSGICSAIEENPQSILYTKVISLHDFILLELLLELDAIADHFGHRRRPLAEMIDAEPMDLFAPTPLLEWQEVLSMWQEAFEWSYYDEVFAGLLSSTEVPKTRSNRTGMPHTSVPAFIAICCIDERECSFRRHLEAVEPDCETMGCPGFFGVEFFFHPAKGRFYEKLCPAPITPAFLIREVESPVVRKREILFTKKSHTFFRGFPATLALGLYAAIQLVMDLYRPKMNASISDAFAHMNVSAKLQVEADSPPRLENNLQVGFTVEQMADRVENLLRGIGLIQQFPSLVYAVAHGSGSANNPHHGAHDCGACSGRPGSVNARVFASMANHSVVRRLLRERGLFIPDETLFLGALHDTASDEMAFYDVENLPVAMRQIHKTHVKTFEKALDLNAKERSRRFASINTKSQLRHVRKAIRSRSVSYFEPRPELGHGTNALCFVGHRDLTKNLFLDRRAFMNSYDWRTDPEGTRLLGVIRPLPVVCGGINLEYYFSRVDNYKLGAGTKLPHNVMGLIGVANSTDGDLRPGLPLQMIEVHDPVRLMFVVEHFPEVILRTIQTSPDLYEWFENRWVLLTAIHPESNQLLFFDNSQFIPYLPQIKGIPQINDIHALIESATEMQTNKIVHATREHIPVHLINR